MAPRPQESVRDIRLRGLTESVIALRGGMDANEEAVVLSSLNNALSNLYACWLGYGVRGRDQVPWAGEDLDKRTVVALVYARGEAEHQQEHVAMMLGYGDGPYGVGPYGGGWLWHPVPPRTGYEPSAALYEQHVLWQLADAPLTVALSWFKRNPPG